MKGGVPQKVETSQMGVSRTQTDGAGVEVGGGTPPPPEIPKTDPKVKHWARRHKNEEM